MCDREVVKRSQLPAGFCCCQSSMEASFPRALLERQGAAGEGTVQAQMFPACEVKLKASMQTAGEPRSLRAGGTTANLCDAFAPSIFKKEDGKKTFKSSEPFLVFQLQRSDIP